MTVCVFQLYAMVFWDVELLFCCSNGSCLHLKNYGLLSRSDAQTLGQYFFYNINKKKSYGEELYATILYFMKFNIRTNYQVFVLDVFSVLETQGKNTIA